MKRLLLLLILITPLLQAQDVLFLKNGEKRSARLAGLDATQYRLEIPLPPPPGTPAGAPQAFATVSIPRFDVDYIEFAPDAALESLLKTAGPAQSAELETRWAKSGPWLSIPRSPSARIGNVLGDLLLRTNDPAQASRALDLFKKIEEEAWSADDKMTARQGRLRAMVATGNAKDAVNEAVEIAAITENPVVLIEAKYILASAADSSLRKLLEENPRWEEDVNVIPERHRLYNDALDFYLYPSLFVGSETEASSRGLWGALGIYQLAGESQKALECARDIVALYPGTKFAKPAADFIASLPEAQRAIDPEKEARNDMASPPDSEDKPAKSPDAKSKNKSNEKQKKA